MRKFKRSLARVAVLSALAVGSLTVQASTNIADTITELDTVADAAIVVGIVVLVFMVGRKLVRRLI